MPLTITFLLHISSAPPEPSPQQLLHSWTWHPLLLLMLSVSAGLYLAGQLRSARNKAAPASRPGSVAPASRRLSRGRLAPVWDHVPSVSFWCGWLVLAFSLLSPIHKVGSALFSVHMSQHELLMLVAAPLIALGRPLLLYLWAFPPDSRDRIAALVRQPWFASVWKVLSAPVIVWLIHAVTLWMWHIPAFYQAAVRNESLHIVQHAMFFGTALLFWWTLIHGRYGRMGYGIAVLYVFTTAVHTGLLGALLTLGNHVWYPIHVGRTLPWHISALTDQQLAGVIMWVPAGVLLFGVALAFLAAWLGESERRARLSRMADIHSEARLSR